MSLQRWKARSRLTVAIAGLMALALAGCQGISLETVPAPSGATPASEEATGTSVDVLPNGGDMDENFRMVGYYAAWDVYERNVQLSRIQAGKLTHINYAFSNISPAGECILGDGEADTIRFFSATTSVSGEADPTTGLRGNFHQFMLLKEKFPRLQVLISIGGWTWSQRFSDVALTGDSRTRFVQSCIDLYLVKYGAVFDGIDIDWEYPVGGGLYPGRPEDKQNFTLLLQEFRRQMTELQRTTGRNYLLTIAASADQGTMNQTDLGAVHQYLDWINLMTYDFHVAEDPVTGLLSPLYGSPRDPDPESRKSYNADAAVRGYLAAGVPAKKLVMGIPLYGRAWRGATGDGLFSPADGPAQTGAEPGYIAYTEIRDLAIPTSRRFWEADAKVPWLFDPETGVFISYEDSESIRWKVEYIQSKRLGGAMVWELGLDGGDLLGPMSDMLFNRN
jgi:chitinase